MLPNALEYKKICRGVLGRRGELEMAAPCALGVLSGELLYIDALQLHYFLFEPFCVTHFIE